MESPHNHVLCPKCEHTDISVSYMHVYSKGTLTVWLSGAGGGLRRTVDLITHGSQGVSSLRLLSAGLPQGCHNLGIPAVCGGGGHALWKAAQNLQDSAHACPHFSGSSLILTVNFTDVKHLGHQRAVCASISRKN